MGNPFTVWILGTKKKILRIDHVVFGPRDAAEHVAGGELFGVEPHALHDLLHNALLIVLVEDGKGARQPLAGGLQHFDVAAQDAHAQ